MEKNQLKPRKLDASTEAIVNRAKELGTLNNLSYKCFLFQATQEYLTQSQGGPQVKIAPSSFLPQNGFYAESPFIIDHDED